MQGGDAIKIKTCFSMEPCHPTMENSITQSAAGQSLLFLSQGLEYSQSDLAAFTKGKCQAQEERDSTAETEERRGKK